MKGLLVVGMLTSHVNVFYGKPSTATTVLKYYVNSISFSGFLFCFGYAVYVAYMRRYTRTTPLRILSGAAKIFAVFVLSSSTYSIFRDKTYGWERFQDILTLQYIPLYNEFLLSFALYYVLTIVLLEPFRWATTNWQRIVCVILVCSIPTIVPSPFTGLVGSIVWGGARAVLVSHPAIRTIFSHWYGFRPPKVNTTTMALGGCDLRHVDFGGVSHGCTGNTTTFPPEHLVAPRSCVAAHYVLCPVGIRIASTKRIRTLACAHRRKRLVLLTHE